MSKKSIAILKLFLAFLTFYNLINLPRSHAFQTAKEKVVGSINTDKVILDSLHMLQFRLINKSFDAVDEQILDMLIKVIHQRNEELNENIKRQGAVYWYSRQG